MASEPRGRAPFGISLGGALFTAQTVSGMEAARAWFGLWHGTWEPVAQIRRPFFWRVPTGREREYVEQLKLRGAEYRLLGTGADRPVVAMKLGNASGAKGTDHPDSFGKQPSWAG